eukprot:17025-Heterococcus_DN1.PRE.1
MMSRVEQRAVFELVPPSRSANCLIKHGILKQNHSPNCPNSSSSNGYSLLFAQTHTCCKSAGNSWLYNTSLRSATSTEYFSLLPHAHPDYRDRAKRSNAPAQAMKASRRSSSRSGVSSNQDDVDVSTAIKPAASTNVDEKAAATVTSQQQQQQNPLQLVMALAVGENGNGPMNVTEEYTVTINAAAAAKDNSHIQESTPSSSSSSRSTNVTTVRRQRYLKQLLMRGDNVVMCWAATTISSAITSAKQSQLYVSSDSNSAKAIT